MVKKVSIILAHSIERAFFLFGVCIFLTWGSSKLFYPSEQTTSIYQAQLRNFRTDTSQNNEEVTNTASEVVVQRNDHGVNSRRLLTVSRRAQSQFPTMVKSVSYFGRGNPLNFWDQRFESFIDSDFKRFKEEGFNTITLLVPWSGFQITVNPPTYKSYFIERVEYVLKKAVEHDLYTIFRVSYEHSNDPANVPMPKERCELIMAADESNGVKEGWLHYMSLMNSIFTKSEYKDTYLYSYISWEDFFCMMSFGLSAPANQRLHLSKYTGFDKFLMKQHTSAELEDMYPGVQSGEYPIPPWDIAHGAYASFIKFIDSKWWDLVELGRTVNPNLSMAVRVDIEGGKVPYDLHLDDDTDGRPMQGYWSGYMEATSGNFTAEVGVQNLEKVLKHSTGDGKSPIILGEFTPQDNTPFMMKVMKGINLKECNEFIIKAATVLKKYTKGYGFWAHRNYRQSEIFNGSFLLGMEGWSTKKGGKGSIELENKFLLLSGQDKKSFAKVEQKVKQLPELECDNGNTAMNLCFRYRMNKENSLSSRLYVLWNGKKEHVIDYSAVWTDKCVHVSTLEINKFYNVGFSVEGATSVNIDNVEFFCHTHNMYMNNVDYTHISTCGDGIPALNKLLDY